MGLSTTAEYLSQVTFGAPCVFTGVHNSSIWLRGKKSLRRMRPIWISSRKMKRKRKKRSIIQNWKFLDFRNCASERSIFPQARTSLWSRTFQTGHDENYTSYRLKNGEEYERSMREVGGTHPSRNAAQPLENALHPLRLNLQALMWAHLNRASSSDYLLLIATILMKLAFSKHCTFSSFVFCL